MSQLSQNLDNPGPQHMAAVKRLLHYLKGTKDYAITYSPTTGELSGYANSDWAGDTTDRRSTTGYIFTLGGAPVSWKSRKQPTVALSSCEAEYMALTDATKEMLYLRSLSNSINLVQPNHSTIYCDNQGAIALTKATAGKHNRTKHIDVRYHFVREQTNIQYLHIDTNSNLADVLTKPLGLTQHNAIKLPQIAGAC